MTISPSYQPSHSSSSSTSTSTFSSTTIFPSLSCYASPISESNSENQKSRVSNKKKKKDSTNKIIVTVRNSNGDELTEIIWPTSFVPYLSSTESSYEQTLNYQTIATSYNLPPSTSLKDVSFLIMPPNYALRSIEYFTKLGEIEIQIILHKYRVKYSSDDTLTNINIGTNIDTQNQIFIDSSSDNIQDVDFHEADRLASLLTMNYEDEDDNFNYNININSNDNNNNNNNNINVYSEDESLNRNSLNNMLNELSNKLSYFDNSQDDDLLLTDERLVIFIN